MENRSKNNSGIISRTLTRQDDIIKNNDSGPNKQGKKCL